MAISGQDFWTSFLTILEGGTLTSSVQYYLPNEGSGTTAQPGEWANVITTTFEQTDPGSPERIQLVNLLADAGFWAPTDKLQFWIDQSLDSGSIEDLKAAAEKRFPNMFQADGTQTDVGRVDNEVGDPSGVMSGGDLVRVERKDGTSYFALRYVVQGIEHLYSFQSEAAAKKAMGSLDNAINLGEDTVNDGDTWLLGDAAGLVGQDENYNVYFDGIMKESALEAGIRNPGMLGRYAADKDIMRIMAEGQAAGWGRERMQAEVRNTSFYQDTLYPGIKSMLDQGIGNPETKWQQYHSSVEQNLERLGYARDADGSYRSKVGELLTKGVTDTKFNTQSQVFIRAEQSAEFKSILNQWVLDATGKTVTFDEWFDVLGGTSTPELNNIVERATIQFQAQQTSLILDPTQIRRIAELTQFSEQEVAAKFSASEQSLLALGNSGLARYGLSVEKIVDATVIGGKESEKVLQLANKTIRELGLADDPKAQFFTGFTQAGRPIKTGLLAAAPEAG